MRHFPRPLRSAALSLLTLLTCAAAPASEPAPATTADLPAARAATMKRYEAARLGIFIHWVQWGCDDAWGMFYRNIPESQYRERVRAFKGEQFNAGEIVALAQASGAGYITFVAKHHDGFCLWDSAFSEFTSMKYPMKRDYVKELSDACRAADLPLFIYYSLGLDWTHPDYLPRSKYLYARPKTAESDATAKDWTPARFENYRRFCLNQLRELSEKYTVAGFWFDPLGAELANAELYRLDEIYAHIRNTNPRALILNKTGITGTEDVLVGERELASIAMHYRGDDAQSRRIRELAEKAWTMNRFKKAEIAVTSQGTWCWSEKAKCLPADRLHAMLVKAADHNANLLLNFGPLPDGSIPADVRREFTALGDRLRRDGFPPLNTTGWRAKRLAPGEALDANEATVTAR